MSLTRDTLDDNIGLDFCNCSYIVFDLRYCKRTFAFDSFVISGQNVTYTRDGVEYQLGYWLHKQRKNKRSGLLLEEREKRLQELVDAGLLKWNLKFNAEESAATEMRNAVDSIRSNIGIFTAADTNVPTAAVAAIAVPAPVAVPAAFVSGSSAASSGGAAIGYVSIHAVPSVYTDVSPGIAGGLYTN
jgi:hypothetical protein